MTSTWRRNADEALPARGKIVGGYVNMAFQKSEAELNGYDEAVVLTADGHVNEASAANLFIVRDGVALTPPVNDDILEGVTRKAILELLANEGIPVEIRSIDRSELYVADEMFLCGTGVQISPVIEIDHRPIGSGESLSGPIADGSEYRRTRPATSTRSARHALDRDVHRHWLDGDLTTLSRLGVTDGVTGRARSVASASPTCRSDVEPRADRVAGQLRARGRGRSSGVDFVVVIDDVDAGPSGRSSAIDLSCRTIAARGTAIVCSEAASRRRCRRRSACR